MEIDVPVANSDDILQLDEPYTIISDAAECSNNIISSRETTPSTAGTKKQKQKSLRSYFDVVEGPESEAIDLALGRFFFSTNISFRVIENKQFLEFVKALRPSYKVPKRKQLSTNILNQVSADIETKVSPKVNPDSCLIIDGWKNPHSNHQTVAFVLHNSDGGRVFLDAFNFTEEELTETAANLNEKLIKCKEMAKEKFKTNLYAVVSDNARNMVAIGN